MRLKKLIVHGFKSFADRTEFVFDAPIVGIVGPNGCGKSNVVDAFKWVLGEQSAKSLRGDAMMDVIFNGSSSRKAGGMAEVVLVFDNPANSAGQRTLNIESDEVYVGRRLFRDGTSEYQLNNQTTRLKDIRDLFLDTGVGVDAYSVIEQGKVAAMLESNPQERRIIFEEAAGISKYKVKKKEAQRKLERVDQNLLRLHDIVEEVEKRLRSVRVQAGRARTFQEHTVRLSELRLSYSLQEYHTLHKQAAELETRRADAQFRLDDLSGDLQTQQNALASQREQLDAALQTRQQVEYELVQAQAQMQSAQQRQQYAQQQLRQIAEQIDSFQADQTAAKAKLAEASQSLKSEQQSLIDLTAEVESRGTEIDQKQQSYRDYQLQLNDLDQQIEQDKQTVLDLMRQLAAASNRLSSIQIERKNLASQQQRLSERRQVVMAEVEAIQSQKQELALRMEQVAAAIHQQQSQMDGKKSDAAALGQQIEVLTQQVGAAKEHRSGLISRQTLLADLEARREGVSEGVKSVLRQRNEKFPFIRGIVADLLQVDVENAHAIEAALNGQDQTLVTDSQESAAVAAEELNELAGRVNLLCIDQLDRSASLPDKSIDIERTTGIYESTTVSHGVIKAGRSAIDLVWFDESSRTVVQHLLGKTYIVNDLATARELHQTGPKDRRYVTLAGEVIEADGTLRIGPLTAAMGLLSRRSELVAIGSQIAEVDSRIEILNRQLADGSNQARAIEEELNTLRNQIYQSNTNKVELTSKLAQAGDKLAAHDRERVVLDRELENLLEQANRLATEETRVAAQRQQLESDQAARQQHIEEMTARQTQTEDELRVLGEELTRCRVTLGQVQEKQLAAEQAVARLTAQESELGQQIERIEKSIQSTESRRGQVEHEIASAQHVEATLASTQTELKQRTESLGARVSEYQKQVQDLTSRVEVIRESHTAAEQELHDVQLRAGEVKVRLESLVQRTMEELQLDLPARYAEGYEPSEMNWDAVGEEIKELRDKIHRLGNVNLDAITEQQELEMREQFLATQLTDLTTSKQQLEELIDTINRESSLRFEETFNAVREHFQGMFRKLFGGGKADVYLETELLEQGQGASGKGQEQNVDPSLAPDPSPLAPPKIDLLDAGIEIIAKPPGKQPCSISQLSGGEKTMTCVALLMSIFKSKPSPFCILDEVDAALDEANNQRFNLIVQEFLEMSQFIVITHSKRTMQIADVLYGVTMQEQGVSKRVAVKFDQVDSQGRIAEHAAA
ncbi:MAG TPA: chromosome segregation protein SMC [Tepidisphaeraceae bacterium]|nr:chromosome segregation protein SMC [Tepidisphaeraceae bacterium]